MTSKPKRKAVKLKDKGVKGTAVKLEHGASYKTKGTAVKVKKGAVKLKHKAKKK